MASPGTGSQLSTFLGQGWGGEQRTCPSFWATCFVIKLTFLHDNKRRTVSPHVLQNRKQYPYFTYVIWCIWQATLFFWRLSLINDHLLCFCPTLSSIVCMNQEKENGEKSLTGPWCSWQSWSKWDCVGSVYCTLQHTVARSGCHLWFC